MAVRAIRLPTLSRTRPGSIDWHTLAATLGDFSRSPLLILDDGGRILFANQAMEDLAGRRREELIGQPFDSLWAGRHGTLAWRARLEKAMGGVRQSCDGVLRVSDGRRAAVSFDLMPLGRRGSRSLIAIVREPSSERTRDLVQSPVGAMLLDIVVTDEGFGTVQAGWLGDRPLPQPGRARCYELLQKKNVRPCTHCPILVSGDSRGGDAEGGAAEHPCVRAPLGSAPGRAIIAMRQGRQSALATLVRSRLDSLADRFRLSPREHECLSHLVAGRSLEEMAELMKISSRTVKFHQANVLTKLGADSRTDLLRLVL